MNKKLKYYFFVFLALLGNELIAQINIELSLDKKTYLEDEPIWIEAKETNTSSKVQYTTPFDPSIVEFCEIVLYRNGGKIFSYRGVTTTISYDLKRNRKGIELMPRDHLYFVKNVLAIFGENDDNHHFVYYLSPGSYTIQVKHNTNWLWVKQFKDLIQEMDLNSATELIDKGTIYSNKISFEIVPPKGEEINIRQKLLNAYRLESQISQESNIENQRLSVLNDILTNHPESVYATAAYHAERGIASKYGQSVWDFEKSLYHFRNSIYAYTLTTGSNISLAKQYFPGILKNYPESKAAEYIKEVFLRKNKLTLSEIEN